MRRYPPNRKGVGIALFFITCFLLFYAFWSEVLADYLVFLEDERDLGNGRKLCIYTEGYTITIPSHKLCPLSIAT